MKNRFYFLAIAVGGLICVLIFSCNKKQGTIVAQKKFLSGLCRYDTVSSLDKMHGDTAIWKLNGQYIMVTLEGSADEEYESESSEISAKLSGSACSDVFAGSARKAAKTTYASGSNISYANISALRASLKTDTYMHTKGLTTSSARIAEETKNVSVTTAYLYAISRESDNDYHMIIGDSQVSASALMNCESSGLPGSSSASNPQINSVRTSITTHFGTDFCGKSGYTHFTPAIKISVLKGSLFYDIDHSPGTIGPAGYQANTSWEMHPVNTIAF